MTPQNNSVPLRKQKYLQMNRIKEILAEKGMTVNELAVKLNRSRQSLSRQIQGKMLVETAEEIARALGVALWELFVSPGDVKNEKMVAFIHYKGTSHTPTTVDEMMSIIKDWKEEEFLESCHRHDFQHLREQHAEDKNIQCLMDSLCALLRNDCTKQQEINQQDK